MIERLVHGFYAKVRTDALLAPVFEARIQDWEPHLAQMCAFWSSVALMTGRYHGTPMVKHMPLPVDAAHFDRWLALFEDDGQAKSVRRKPQRILSSAPGGLPPASNSASRAGRASCSEAERDFGAAKQERSNDARMDVKTDKSRPILVPAAAWCRCWWPDSRSRWSA